MKKQLMIVVIALIFLSIVSLISVNNVKADEDGWNFNWFDFGYYWYTTDTLKPFLNINCSFPEGRPHLYEPYPYWDPGHYETLEKFYLKMPHLEDNITGEFYGNNIAFYLDRNYISPGDYKLFITDENGYPLFSHEFFMGYDFIVNVSDLDWIYDCSGITGGQPSTYTIGNPIDEEKIDSVCGFKLFFTLENIGEIPYFIGIPTNNNILIDYKFNLYKNGSDVSIFSTKIIPMFRHEAEYSGEGWGREAYIPTGERFNYTAYIFFNDEPINLNEYGSGDYSIDGYVFINPENLSYGINSDSNITLIVETSGGTPGFEIILVIGAIIIVLLCKIYWRRKDE